MPNWKLRVCFEILFTNMNKNVCGNGAKNTRAAKGACANIAQEKCNGLHDATSLVVEPMSAEGAAITVYTDGDSNGGALRVVKNQVENGDTYQTKHGANCLEAKSDARMWPSCEDIVRVGSTSGNQQTLRVKQYRTSSRRRGKKAKHQSRKRSTNSTAPRSPQQVTLLSARR